MSAPILLTLLLSVPQTPEAQVPGPGVRPAADCATCHSASPRARAMRDRQGRSVAPYDLWSGSMMANSSRDPLWRASVSAEVAASPGLAAEIEGTCMRCHAPLAQAVGLDDHGTGSLLHALECDSELGTVARDGASCTLCHGLSPEGLGSEETFSGRFRLDPLRRLFGPHEDPFLNPMRAFTGFTPTHGPHVLDAALCATCHTLETETIDSEGALTEHTFLEQAPYLEWRNSAFHGEAGRGVHCQQCHLPRQDQDGQAIETEIARNPGGRDFPATEPRQPFGRHLLVGGNTLLPAILRDHRDELGVTASDEALEATLAATREQLEQRTASLSIEEARLADGRLHLDVLVRNRTGHKLPTGHPTRRAWLRVRVTDGAGRELLVSGEVDDQGRIEDGQGRVLPSELAGGPVDPHRDRVAAPDEVALFQAIPADLDGRPTFLLTRAASWLVDGRLLPQGWDPEHPEAARTAPVGTAGDGDFLGGRDTVHYDLAVEDDGPLEVEVELLYQTLGARWAAELFEHDTPEVRAFERMWRAADRAPVVLARRRVRVEGRP